MIHLTYTLKITAHESFLQKNRQMSNAHLALQNSESGMLNQEAKVPQSLRKLKQHLTGLNFSIP